MYNPKVMDHFSNPRNVGEIKDADGIGKVGNPVCGDLMWIYIKVKDDVIVDIKFKTFGCGAAIATSSMVTELAKGKTIQEGLKITRNDVAEQLGGLPPVKMHCSNLAADALHLAIADYLKKQGRPVPKLEEMESEVPLEVVEEENREIEKDFIHATSKKAKSKRKTSRKKM
ncbi:MAG: Fe-S cluster assembly scaffold protein NifU [Thermoplasmata archaeon]